MIHIQRLSRNVLLCEFIEPVTQDGASCYIFAILARLGTVFRIIIDNVGNEYERFNLFGMDKISDLCNTIGSFIDIVQSELTQKEYDSGSDSFDEVGIPQPGQSVSHLNNLLCLIEQECSSKNIPRMGKNAIWSANYATFPIGDGQISL